MVLAANGRVALQKKPLFTILADIQIDTPVGVLQRPIAKQQGKRHIMQEQTYIYSQLSSHSVGSIVALNYDLPAPVRCQFYVLGLHDNYLIECEAGKFIFRIYRNDWRSLQEVNFELELLSHLSDRGAGVAAPLRTRTGELSLCLDSPEGNRAAALFHYADGLAPGKAISLAEGELLGHAVATVHQLTETFTSSWTRPVLDIRYLVDDSIIAIAPFIDAEARRYLTTLQEKLHAVLPGLSREAGVYGICHGDINLSNFHINDNRQITLFDFDQCGFGYRAFEIGKFVSSIHGLKTRHEVAAAFIKGYEQVRRLNSAEVDMIPYFEMASIIWVMAIHAQNADRIGHKLLQRPFWDRRLEILQRLAEGLYNN